MANTIKVKRGSEINLPILAVAELAFTTDTPNLYVGDGALNHRLAMYDELISAGVYGRAAIVEQYINDAEINGDTLESMASFDIEFSDVSNKGLAVFNADDFDVADGVVSLPIQLKDGSYNNVTVNAKGLVTAASNVSYEPSFTKNTAFNKNFGTVAGTVLEGRTFGTAANNNTGDFLAYNGTAVDSAKLGGQLPAYYTDIVSRLGYTPYNSTNPNNYIALTNLSSTATGLTYTDTSGVFSLTSGYVIPTTGDISNGNTAFGWGDWHHTTLSGYGITDSYTKINADVRFAKVIGKNNLENVFKTALIKNLEADNTLPTGDYTGRTRPIATQMILVSIPAANTYIIANMPYVKDLVTNPTNWVFWDMTAQPQPDTAAKKCLSIVYTGVSGSYTNCYTITTNLPIANAVAGDSMAMLSFKAYYYSNPNILFPRGTVSTDFNYSYTNNLSYVWKTQDGIYHGIVLGQNKTLPAYTYVTNHHYTANNLLGPWTDLQAGSPDDLFDDILPSTYVAYNMLINGHKMPGSDGMHYLVGGVNKSDGTGDLAAVIFSDDLSYKRFIVLNTSGYTWNGTMQAWTSTTFYKGEYLVSVQDGPLLSGERIVLKSNNLDGIFSLHSTIAAYSDTEIIHPGSMFSGAIANGVLYVFNNELYYFSSGQSNDVTSGNQNNHEIYLWKYSDTDNNWNLVVTPCIVALHGDSANYGTEYVWGQDHCAATVPLTINENDGRLYIAMGYEAGTDTYQGTIGYIDLK